MNTSREARQRATANAIAARNEREWPYSLRYMQDFPAGPVEKWFRTRTERALWMLEHSMLSHHLLSYSDPENDFRDNVFDVD